MPTAAFTHKPVLTGELVQLRPVMAADAPGLVALARDEAGSHSASPGGAGLRDLAAAQRWYGTCGQRTDRLDLAVVERATDGFIGEAVLSNLDPYNASCTFRLALLGPYGDGHRAEAAGLVLAHAFDVAGMHRIETQTAAHENRIRAAYEAAGFVHEGTRREAIAVDGARVDLHVLAALADDRDER
ncbi:GNAT family N-acetyltransferase [Prauserella rugosa]|uniref:RimJ/RimL family protein N-acetyltransferase n=1 Tax=Prauserella rugosa TaxID=43354 RepID=A0A660CAV0_9PSEU|nr:GNAT family protein [Prauserella rugosa]KID28415.1 acetyltransferase, ribosomal protein N-acetylase [Prauserella sp. Am3]KMS85521.1 hypothetical protein ACZ91_41900 [Streptomyces regensis]TWH20592.1 RimJ/RimL family protein N-acetyltransferase [Prauserella rugosa]